MAERLIKMAEQMLIMGYTEGDASRVRVASLQTDAGEETFTTVVEMYGTV